MTRLEAVFRKECHELVSNRALVYSFLALILFFVVFPLVLLAVILRFSPHEAAPGELSEAVRLLTRLVPGLTEMSRAEQASVLIIRHFTLIFLILPVIGALGSSTSSIVGEKQSRSIEPVLATPVSTFELLLGKSLATVILAVSGTWGGFLAYYLLSRRIAGSSVIEHAFDLTTWLMVLLLTPLIAALGLGAGVVISSRVNDSRSAQQIGGLLVLPVVFLIAGQMTGLFVLGPVVILGTAAVLFLLDLALLWVGIRVFDREKIITEWK